MRQFLSGQIYPSIAKYVPLSKLQSNIKPFGSDLEAAEEELDIFSDLIWEGVLNKVSYLENISAQHMHLFEALEKEIKLISVKVLNPDIDLNTAVGFAWFKKNYQGDFVEYLSAAKAYKDPRNSELFDLIKQGASITKGDLYQWFDNLID